MVGHVLHNEHWYTETGLAESEQFWKSQKASGVEKRVQHQEEEHQAPEEHTIRLLSSAHALAVAAVAARPFRSEEQAICCHAVTSS